MDTVPNTEPSDRLTVVGIAIVAAILEAADELNKPGDTPTEAAQRWYLKRAGEIMASANRYVRGVRQTRSTTTAAQHAPVDAPADAPPAASSPAAVAGEPSCPTCGGRMWDNRLSKRNPKAPDFKCRDRGCDGVIWPPKPAGARPAPNAVPYNGDDDGDEY